MSVRKRVTEPDNRGWAGGGSSGRAFVLGGICPGAFVRWCVYPHTVFCLLAKVCKETDVERMFAGNSTAPVTAKLRVPSTVIARKLPKILGGTVRTIMRLAWE